MDVLETYYWRIFIDNISNKYHSRHTKITHGSLFYSKQNILSKTYWIDKCFWQITQWDILYVSVFYVLETRTCRFLIWEFHTLNLSFSKSQWVNITQMYAVLFRFQVMVYEIDLKILVLWYPQTKLLKLILLSQMSLNKFHNIAKINDKAEQNKNKLCCRDWNI
jgi:hypothetical protein